MVIFSILTLEDAFNSPVYESWKEDVDNAEKKISEKVINYVVFLYLSHSCLILPKVFFIAL